MKKLVFIFAMVFAVSIAMAQKITYVNQSGNYNEANITQSACLSGDATFIYATQSGDHNDLTTSQMGENNFLSLLQSGNENTAVMDQFTCNDFSNHGDNNAYITQEGDDNSATLTQKENDLGYNNDDSRNMASAVQSGDDNTYILNQGSRFYRPDNKQYLTQSGDDNDATLTQTGQVQYSEIRQGEYSDYNTAILNQYASDDVAGSSDVSYSWQLGQDNTITITQNDDVTEYAYSYQGGHDPGNITNIAQVGGAQQDVNATQNGFYDELNVDQQDE